MSDNSGSSHQLNKQLDHQEVVKQAHTFPLSVLANNIEIAGNVGSLFRITDALGIEKLYLTGTTAIPPKYKIRKAARSADQRVDYSQATSAIEVVTQLKSDGYTIISLEITTQSMDLRSFTKNHSLQQLQPICLIIGAEQEGITQELLNASDFTLHIPMYGENSSMNVATSCAILIYELIRDYH